MSDHRIVLEVDGVTYIVAPELIGWGDDELMRMIDAGELEPCASPFEALEDGSDNDCI